MMIAVVLLASLNASVQFPPRDPSDAWYRSHLPVTLKVTQDVQVKPYSRSQRHQRATLEIGGDAKAFTIKQGETFQMMELLGEGGCRIRFLKKNYSLGSCPWLEGFASRETDIYQPVTTPRPRGLGPHAR
ncbi:MAG: hypothetical protein V7647_298 [Acidobacteriota bacterium]|jgi:hypothetical protein